MGLKKIVRYFSDGNVCVTGLRGRGKDMLIANVIARRKRDYISNMDYAIFDLSHIPLNLDSLNLAHNSYKNFIAGNVNKYEYPYPEDRDIYLSDAGVYFPSQYCNELNKFYPELPYFMALSRQIAHANFHINVQNLNRAWDKIREQSDIYIYCRWCRVLPFGIVVQGVTVYDKYESCVNRVKPFRVSLPVLGNSQSKMSVRLSRDKFEQDNGTVHNMVLVYFNRSHYDTRYFKKLLNA